MVGELLRLTIARKNSNGKTIYSSKNINSKNLKKYGVVKRNKETGEVVYAKKYKTKSISGKIVNRAKVTNSKMLFKNPEGYYEPYIPKKIVAINVRSKNSYGETETKTIYETQERIKIGYRKKGKSYVRNDKPFVSKDDESPESGIPLPGRFISGTITFEIPLGNSENTIQKVTVYSKTQTGNTTYSKSDLIEQSINFGVAFIMNQGYSSVSYDKVREYIINMDLDLVKWV